MQRAGSTRGRRRVPRAARARADAATHCRARGLALALERSVEASDELARAVALEPERSEYRWDSDARASAPAARVRCVSTRGCCGAPPDPGPKRGSSAGRRPYGHPYPFAPDAARRGLAAVAELWPSFASELAASMRIWAYSSATNGAGPGDFALVPYASAGVLTGGRRRARVGRVGRRDHGFVGGPIAGWSGFGYGAGGHVGLSGFGRVIGELRALAAYTWMGDGNGPIIAVSSCAGWSAAILPVDATSTRARGFRSASALFTL